MPAKKEKKKISTQSLLATGLFYLLSVMAISLSISNLALLLKPESPTIDFSYTYKDELLYWKELVSKHPTYRDAYLEVARLETILGNISGAQEALAQAEELDPNPSY